MQKPPTRTHRQTAVGELGLVIAARMSNDHNYMLNITFLSIAECVINVCMCVYKREDYDNEVFSCGDDNYRPHDRLLYLLYLWPN